MNDLASMLDRVRAADFTLIDAGLYLNTHPDCPGGLDLFRRAQSERQAAVRAYEAVYGPLTVDAAQATGAWDWTASPWPWEMEG